MIIYCGMENNYRLYCRTLEESTPIAGLQDYYNLYFDANIKREILSLNPLKNSSQDFFQILGIRDGIFVGTGIHYPILLSVNSKYYKSVTGHSLYVHPSYRGKGLGSIITDRRLDFSESNSILICNASQMNIPILHRLGAYIFYMPRLIFLKKSFSVLGSMLNVVFAKFLSPIVDLFLNIQNYILIYLRNDILSKGFVIQDLKNIPESVEAILNADKHPYKEVATKEWFQWVKDNTLIANDAVKKYFYMIYKDDLPVGFYMTRERFYKQASHRGFRNITLGSILDWATIDENLISNNEVALLAVTSFGKRVDAVELCCDTKQMASYFKRRGLVQIGSGNIVFRYRPNSVFAKIKDIGNPEKWRLRPSMGDNALS